MARKNKKITTEHDDIWTVGKDENVVGNVVVNVNDDNEIIKSNFNRGFDVEEFRGGMVALWGFLGLLGAGAIGAGSLALYNNINSGRRN